MLNKEIPNIQLTEKSLSALISALLFSCSVNVTSNTNEEYQRELFELAKYFKKFKPDIKLDDIQFLKEDNYEDSITPDVFEEFKNNFEITTFDKL